MHIPNVQTIIMQRNENGWSYRLHKPDAPKAFWMEKMSKFNTPQKEKIVMKYAQKRRCTSSIIVQSLNINGWKLGDTDYTNKLAKSVEGVPTTRSAFCQGEAGKNADFNGEQEKRIHYLCVNVIEKSALRISICHHSASLIMSNSDRRIRFFYPTLKLLLDSVYNPTNAKLLCMQGITVNSEIFVRN